MDKLVRFSVDEFDIDIDEINDNQFATATVKAFSSGLNKHKMFCSDETLKDMAFTIFEKPIIYNIRSKRSKDFESHGWGFKKSIPAGFIIPDSAKFETDKDGVVSLFVQARIWKYYAHEFLTIFENSEDSKKKVSVEMQITNKKKRKNSRISDMLTFAFTAITVIGDRFIPASPGAEMEMVAFTTDDYIREFRNFTTYDNVDFKASTRVSDNSARGLTLLELNGFDIDNRVLDIAKQIVEGDGFDPGDIDFIIQTFDDYSQNDLIVENSKDWVTWLALGGHAGRQAVTRIKNEMESDDEKVLSVINEGDSAIMKDELVVDTGDAVESEIEPTNDDTEPEKVGMSVDESITDNQNEPEQESESDPETDNVEQDDSDVVPFTLTAENIDSQLQSALQAYQKEQEVYEGFRVLTHDSEFAYVRCYGDNKIYKMAWKQEGDGVVITMSKDNEQVMTYKDVETARVEMETFESLVKFKADIERAEFNANVDNVLLKVSNILQPETISDLKEKVTDFETLDGWENLVKATAFEATQSQDESTDDEDVQAEDTESEIVEMALPDTPVTKKKKNVWAD